MRRAVITLTAFLGGLIFLLASGSTTAWAEGEGLKGRLVHQGQPVNGVKISVADESGAHVGEATTDAQGEWAVPVPEAGTYKVSIDQSSLPQGVALRDPNRATLTVQVYEGNQRNVLFALVAAGQQQQQQGENAPPSEAEQYWSRVAQLAFEGLSLGLTIALGAVGLSLIFGTTGLTNFSHGELLTIGAFTAYLFNTAFGLHLLIAAPLAVLVAAAFGYGQDRFFWGVLRKRQTGIISMMIISIGVAILLRYMILFFFGGEGLRYEQYVAQQGIQLGPISATPKSLVAMAIQIVVLVGVGLALTYTRIGKATRAVADNPALAASSGINVDRVIRVVWTVGTAIAALAGVLLGMIQNVQYQMGLHVLLLMFAGVILGGLGTTFGALVGSIIVGVFIQLSTLWIPPEMKNIGALAILILVLLFRPQGILGRRERIG